MKQNISAEDQRNLWFLRYALGIEKVLPSWINEIDWQQLFNFSIRQSIVGLMFRGIERLPKDGPRPPRSIILNWYAQTEQLKKQNIRLNMASARIASQFQRDGHRCCILKGQGNALMYPDPLSRTPGDVDVLMEGSRMEINRYIKGLYPSAGLAYHHIYFSADNIPIEVHYTASFNANLFYNSRLQHFLLTNKNHQFENKCSLPNDCGEIYIPNDDYNRIFQLSHIMVHFFFEGIGLRQMTDYYYLLQHDFSEEERQKEEQLLRHFCMHRFARAVMFVMKKVYCLDDKHLLVEPEEKTGSLLLDEILASGNFGYYDKRYHFSAKGRLGQYMLEVWRNLHYARYFPQEAIFGRPIWRIWHQFYKAWMNFKIKNDAQN